MAIVGPEVVPQLAHKQCPSNGFDATAAHNCPFPHGTVSHSPTIHYHEPTNFTNHGFLPEAMGQ